ncbi:hypothetical protein CPT_Ptah_040 [Stenotrophomonas phage Ptah]|uniref:Uncharacterized protein n=1 Tax=Stenotrophomonas phage Ptah TaxID=2859657 RepID=A0AAE7WLQ2_9CAUD|nr:hypothetical protein CPT_Ptah_040 [Stenotrophomonas phage Ptah]
MATLKPLVKFKQGDIVTLKAAKGPFDEGTQGSVVDIAFDGTVLSYTVRVPDDVYGNADIRDTKEADIELVPGQAARN